jgi:hypothetical protein
MAASIERDRQAPGRKRPIGVWIICIYFTISLIFTIYSFWAVLSGAIELDAEMEAYFQSLRPLDYALSTVTGVISLAFIVMLFRLKRPALPLFGLSFALMIVSWLMQTEWAALAENYAGIIAGGLTSLLVNALILLYVYRLDRKGVLT